jgi:hypothetical protein
MLFGTSGNSCELIVKLGAHFHSVFYRLSKTLKMSDVILAVIVADSDTPPCILGPFHAKHAFDAGFIS